MMKTPNSQPIRITIDDRERIGPLPALLVEDSRFQVETMRLACGDYQIDSRFLFERKTLPDLIQSIISGRLFKQALRLVEQSQFKPALILEGTSRDLAGTQMSWEAIQGALVNVTLVLGLPVLRARCPADTISTMAYAAQQNRVLTQGGLPRKGRRPRGKRALQLHILQGLPGVGRTRAARLIDHFGSVRLAINASAEEWAELAGIGKVSAETMDWAVRECRARYGGSTTAAPKPPEDVVRRRSVRHRPGGSVALCQSGTGQANEFFQARRDYLVSSDLVR